MQANLYGFGKDSYNNLKRRIRHCKNALMDRLPKILVLVYHRVLPEVRSNPLNTIVSLKKFTEQIDTLSERFPIISLKSAIDQSISGRAQNKIQVVLTFDDGYVENYEIVFPLLKKKGLNASFFIATDYIGSSSPMWEWQIANLLNGDRKISSLEIDGQVISKRPAESESSFIYRIIGIMKSLNTSTISMIIERLKKESKNATLEVCMSWEQVQEMSRQGMEIGSHGTSHRSLAKIPLSEALSEIKSSKEIIESRLKNNCIHFSFPFGSRKDYNQTLIENVKKAGFQTCLLNIHGYNHITKDSFCFKRIIMEESTDLRYLLG